MKVSLNWLTDFVDVGDLPAAEIGEVLTRIGICCEGIEQTPTDVVFDLEVTSNRPDCLGHIGIARELAAALHRPLRLPDLSAVPAGPTPVAELTSVEVQEQRLCPRYTARVIRGVRVGPSPDWMVQRLEAVGLRGINNVVDVTNYILMEYGQPLHAFDLDRLHEGRIVVRRARQGELLVSIDGTKCHLSDEMLIIADAEKPVAVAGIMGGANSEVTDGTTNLLIESAQFDPLTTRRTARALGLMSESSYRFERGVDPVAVDAASLRACELILQTAGGELAEGVVDIWPQPYRAPEVTMRTDRCRALLGVDVDDATQADILDRLGLSARLEAGRVRCRIPAHRPDLRREADLIEEVARLYGYDRIPTYRQVTHPVPAVPAEERLRRSLREALSAAGFDEAVTYGFVDDAEAALFGFEQAVRVDRRVRRTNNLLRPTLLPALLRACKTNQDVGNEQVRLYELAAVFEPAGDARSLPNEYVCLGMVAQSDLRGLRGALEAVVARVAPTSSLEIVPAAAAGLAEGASGQVRIDGRAVGQIGLISPQAQDYYGLEKPVAAAAIRFDALLAGAGAKRSFRPLPRFPAVRRDLSIVVDEGLTWRELEAVIRAEEVPELQAVEYVTTYRGRQIPRGKKSVTVSLTYRGADRTLRHDEVGALVERLVARLGERLGAKLRAQDGQG